MFSLECKTEKSKENCIFPFKFGGKKYNACTKDYSDNGLPWCATAVYRNGTRGPGYILFLLKYLI